MREPSLADEFAYMADNAPREALGGYVQVYRDRILAALRAIELVTATVSVCEERGLFVPPSNVRANLLGFASPAELALANEAGEREPQG